MHSNAILKLNKISISSVQLQELLKRGERLCECRWKQKHISMFSCCSHLVALSIVVTLIHTFRAVCTLELRANENSGITLNHRYQLAWQRPRRARPPARPWSHPSLHCLHSQAESEEAVQIPCAVRPFPPHVPQVGRAANVPNRRMAIG